MDLEHHLAPQSAPPGMADPSSNAVFASMAALSAPIGLACVKLLADLPATLRAGCWAALHADARRPRDGGDARDLGRDGAHPCANSSDFNCCNTTCGVNECTKPRARRRWSARRDACRSTRARDATEEVTIWTQSEHSPRIFVNEWPLSQSLPRDSILHGKSSKGRGVLHSDAVCRTNRSGSVAATGSAPQRGGRTPQAGPLERSMARRWPEPSVFVSSRATALVEPGNLLRAFEVSAVKPDHALVELGAVIVGTAPRRQSPDEITLYDSVRLGLQDLAIWASALRYGP